MLQKFDLGFVEYSLYFSEYHNGYAVERMTHNTARTLAVFKSLSRATEYFNSLKA